MDWSYEIKEINNDYHKIIYNSELKEVVAIVDNLDKDFIQNIIDKHNKAVSNEYRKGLRDGVDIVKEQYENKKKGKK